MGRISGEPEWEVPNGWAATVYMGLDSTENYYGVPPSKILFHALGAWDEIGSPQVPK